MAFLNSYSVLTTHGIGAKRLFASLCEGRRAPFALPTENWRCAPAGRTTAFYHRERIAGETVRAQLSGWLGKIWDDSLAQLPAEERAKFLENFSLIFASTKGAVEDFIWTESSEQDPFTNIIEDFLKSRGLRPAQWLSVSNACASSHSALALGLEWIASGRARNVAVVAADWIGPFVLQGFHALHALSPTELRPFSGERDGLLLGDGAGIALLGSEASAAGVPSLTAAVDCEGYAVTRPSESGASLAAAIRNVYSGDQRPDLIVAHGTGTVANDAVEDAVFHALYGNDTAVTCTKWSVGHTLGASGLVDLAAAAEILRTQKIFAIGATQSRDPAFRARVLTAGAPLPAHTIDDILVTALGFGGVHAALRLARNSEAM